MIHPLTWVNRFKLKIELEIPTERNGAIEVEQINQFINDNKSKWMTMTEMKTHTLIKEKSKRFKKI